jgi:hypothetical protein
MKRYRILGTTDDVTTCDCCGRENLKKTVALAALDADGNEIGTVYYGVDCAAKAEGLPAKLIRKEAETADRAKGEAKRREARDRRDAEDAQWFAWLDARAPHLIGDRLLQIEALGGYGAASAAYAAKTA